MAVKRCLGRGRHGSAAERVRGARARDSATVAACSRDASLPALPLDVWLLDAENRQTLACLRSLGRIGLRVGAVATEKHAGWAPGCRSRWCTARAMLPDFDRDAAAYADALLRLLDRTPAQLLIPAHDGSIEAVRSRRGAFERRVALPLASEAALDVAVSKVRTLALATALGIAVPRGVLVSHASEIAPAVREVGVPAVVKPAQSWVEQHGAGTRLGCVFVQSCEEATRSIDYILSVGGKALIQEWLPGRREAVTLFYAGGRFFARFAQVSHREWPLIGGVSVLCESIPLHRDLTEPAERLVRAIDLEGCSMVEFRRDRGGRPVLMEINPRMGASVSLAISAGIDIPRLLYAWKLGGELQRVRSYRVGVRRRWLAGDIWHLKSVFDGHAQPDTPPRARALGRFLSDFLQPNIALDNASIRDMRPMLAEFQGMVIPHVLRRITTAMNRR